jgi:hypothetical protein
MSNDDIDKAYFSPYDKFLYAFDEKHIKTASQVKEIEKHQRIAHMRDNKDYLEPKTEIWTDF